MSTTPNICAGPFGALYDFYIERPTLMRMIGRVVWGIDASVLYECMAPIAEAEDATILDVPCGGGVALRMLRPEQNVRYVAADIDAKMLARAKRRAERRRLGQVEVVRADMLSLPFDDEEADLVVCLSGLHMVDDSERAVRELVRCLKPGGRLVGTSFVADMRLRGRVMFGLGVRRRHPYPPRRADLRRWLSGSSLCDVEVGEQVGFVSFSARKPLVAP